MSLLQRLLPYAADQHGYVTVDNAREEGGTPMALVMLAQRGSIEHVNHGLYRIPELAGGPLGRHQEALLRFPGAVLAGDTALDLHELADVNPRRVQVVLPTGQRLRKETPTWLEIRRGALQPADVTYLEGLAIVTPARAIIDAVELGTGRRFIDQALETARRRNLLTTREDQAVTAAIAVRDHSRVRAGAER